MGINMSKRKTPEERFHEKYIKDPDTSCWIWTGCTSNGYGRIYYKGRLDLAPRVSWKLHNGPIPEGKLVCHHCDTPPCVNPDHLFIGTQKDNMTDAREKGRLKVKATKGRAEEKVMELFDRARNKHESVGWDMLGYNSTKGND